MARKCERRGTILRLSIRETVLSRLLFFCFFLFKRELIDRIDGDRNQIFRNVFRSSYGKINICFTSRRKAAIKKIGSLACRGTKRKKKGTFINDTQNYYYYSRFSMKRRFPRSTLKISHSHSLSIFRSVSFSLRHSLFYFSHTSPCSSLDI